MASAIIAGNRVVSGPADAPNEALAPAWTRKHYVLFGILGLLIGLWRATRPVSDTDILWSTRYGLSVLSGHLPRHDPYSWSAAGKQWIPSSWGWNVILATAYKVGRIPAIWVVGVALSCVLALVAARACERIGARPVLSAMTITILGALALVAVPRAQAVGYVLIFGILAALPALVFGDRLQSTRAGFILVALQVLWINLHSAGIVGPAFVAACGTALLFRRDVDRRARLIGATRIAIATALTALACAATPYGFAMIKHVPEVRRASVGIINEWQHPGFASAGQGVSLAVMIAGLGIALVSWRAGRHHIAVALLLLAALTWSAIRFAPMLGVVMIPEVALLLGRAKARPFMLRRILALGLALITIATVVGLPHFGTVGPEESARLVRELPPRAVVVNDYLAGNAVILLRPDARVSVDGRNDMYGRATVIRMIDLLRDRPGTAQAMDEAGVTAVLAYSYAPLVKRLIRDPEWRVIDRDHLRTLLVKSAPGTVR